MVVSLVWFKCPYAGSLLSATMLSAPLFSAKENAWPQESVVAWISPLQAAQAQPFILPLQRTIYLPWPGRYKSLQNRKKTGTVQDGSSDIRICPPWHENAGDHSLIGDGRPLFFPKMLQQLRWLWSREATVAFPCKIYHNLIFANHTYAYIICLEYALMKYVSKA
jgi:hypothetical protein